jgi:EXS family
MDWGMMKNPTVAATVFCNPASGMVNSAAKANNGPYASLLSGGVTINKEHLSSGAHLQRKNIVRSPSGAVGPASFSCWYALLRNRLRFGIVMSVFILVTDAILRFSWTLRFYHRLFPSGDSFVLCTQFLEVFRRAIWNLLRVEWENLKQSGHHLHHHNQPTTSAKPASIQLPPMMNPGDDEKTAFLVQRGNASLSKLPHGSKITVEKNAEA